MEDKKLNDNFRLYPVLKKYSNEDFATQMKVKFIFLLLVSFIILLSFIIGATGFIQLKTTEEHALKWPVIIAEFSLLLIFGTSLILLVKGFYRVVSQAILLLTFVTIWIVMFLDTSNNFTRLDTIVYILLVFLALPIFTFYKKWNIFFYTIGNLITFGIFVFLFFSQNPHLSIYTYDYITDNSITLIIAGVLAYNNLRIHSISMQKANEDLKSRISAEESLLQSEKKYREITELLPQTVFEAEISGKLTYVNQNGFKQFGYSEEDLQRGLNVIDTIHPDDRERTLNIIQGLIKGISPTGNLYYAMRKDGSAFPVQIFTNIIFQDSRPIGFRGVITDMTERIHFENELKKSRDQFQSLVDNIPGIVYRCLYNKGFTMLFISSEAEKLCGYAAQDFINNQKLSFSSIIHPEDIEKVISTIAKAVENKASWETEYRILHKDQHILWVNEKGRAIYNDCGEVEYLDGLILDITQRKNAEEALLISENRFKQLFFNAPVALAYLNDKGDIKGINNTFINTLGYTTDDLPNLDVWWEKAYPEKAYREKVLSHWDQKIKEAIANGMDMAPSEYYVIDKKGQGHYMLIGASVQKFNTLFSLVDITERKKAEEALKQSEEQFKTLIEFLPYSVMVTDMQERYVMVNKVFCQNMGYSQEEVIGKTGTELNIILKYENAEEQKRLLYKQGHIENIEMEVTVQKTNKHYIYFSAKVIMMNNEPYLLCTSVNVTEKKKIEDELENYRKNLEMLVQERTEELATANEELEATNEELSSTNEVLLQQREEIELALKNLQKAQLQLIESEKMASLGVLAAGVAHEINNPLNFIQGGVVALENYIQENYQNNTKEATTLFNAINTGVERVSKIVNSLGRFSRQSGANDELCDIHFILDNCLVMLQNVIKYKATVTKHFTTQPFRLLANEGKLHQAFLNIISNAAQAIEKNGEITITTAVENNILTVSVKDTGKGIKQEYLGKIFDPFFTTKDPGKGTGLGLAITYKIIKELGGNITAESSDNQGTTILVELPVATK